MNDPYATLGLSVGASPDECKAAFRTLAKTCHPDLHPNDPAAEARFKEINAAYDAITNPQPEQPQFGGPNWNFNFKQGGFGGFPFGDIFAQMHNNARNHTTHEVRITLEEAFVGKEISLDAQGKELKVRIPPGVEDGIRFVVQRGQANPRANDLHILIRVLPHSRFSRHGMNLSTIIPVTAFDVLLGNDIEVVAIDGHTIRMAIPKNFDSTRKLRLAGQGMQADGTHARGDLVVELYIQFPVVAEEYLETLAQIADKTATWS